MDRIPENSIIMDLRPQPEYEKWHIPGSINIDLKSLSSIVETGDKSKNYFFYCKKGLNSAYASSIMISNGFKSFYSTEKDLKKAHALNN
jgi:thiamine biosynthesis protein ThiI